MTQNRRTGLWMIALAVTSIAGWMLTDVPDIEETNDQARAFYASGPGPVKTIIAFYLCLLSVVCLLSWLGSLRQCLEHRGGHLPEAGRGAAVGYATLVVAGWSSFLLPTAYDRLGFAPDPQADLDPLFLRTASAMGDAFVLIAAPVLLAVVVAVVCHATSAARLIPRWATVGGYVVAALLLIGWTWFPMIVFFLWALTVGITLTVPRRRAASRREPRLSQPAQAGNPSM